jgi:hypothetical protein
VEGPHSGSPVEYYDYGSSFITLKIRNPNLA